MSRKLIATRINEAGQVTVKVYRDSDWSEYVVRTIDLTTGKAYEPADGFCSDKQEALDLADYYNQWDWQVVGCAESSTGKRLTKTSYQTVR